MPLDRRAKVDVTPAGEMTPVELANFAKSLIGSPHTDANGKVIGEVRAVKVINGKLIAEIKLTAKVILG